MSHTSPPLPLDHAARMDRVRLALDGLSVGDSYGEQFFMPANRRFLIDDFPFQPPGPWTYTDDTEMALGITEVLDRHGRIDQDDLAKTFARRFRRDQYRGYGPGAFRLLTAVANGGMWQLESKSLFSGMGSFGNGSAMRVAPVAAYFAEDGLERVAEEARLASEVTHRHHEGIAGGIATAIAGAVAWQNRERAADPDVRGELFDAVLAHTPSGEVREAIEHARIIEPGLSVRTAASLLGNGLRVSCQDTVPYCLWVATRHLSNYESAIWSTIQVGGDIDTTAAIVGGIVVLATGRDAIPAAWLSQREELMWE